jgi:hypothetical protein
MPGSARWDQDQPEDSRESTVDLPRLTNYPESPDPAPPREPTAPYRAAPRRPPVPGRRPAEPWPDPPARPQAGPWDETGSWPAGPSQPELSRPAPPDRSSRHSAPRRPAAGPEFPASQPPADAPDPALTELAERIRELQALAARPSPGGSPSDPPAPRSEPRAPRSALPAPRSELAGAPGGLAGARSDPGTPVSEPPVSRSEPAPPYVPDVSQSHANSGTARQDYVVSDPRAAEPPSAADGEFAVRDDPAPAPRSRGGEYLSSQGYTSGQEHRAMDRRRGPADGASMPADRPVRGSLAELRLRLERLPAGHPSSPYDETGARRPAPEQLRQLELPLADEDEHPIRSSLLAPVAEDRSGARQNGFSRAAYGDDLGADEPALINRDLADPEPADPGPGDPELGNPGLGDAGLGDAGLGHAGADEPDYESSEDRNGRYRNGQYGNGQYGNGRPDQGEPDRYEPSPSRGGQNGNGRNGHGRDRDGDRDRDDLDDYATARPSRGGAREPGDLAASGLMPRVAGGDPLAPAGGFRSQDDADTSSLMPRVPAPAGEARPLRNGSRGPDDRAASGLLPRVGAAEPLPARNGSRPYEDPEASGLLPRVPGAGALPARNGSRPYDDPDASGLLPRVPAAADDAPPARNGSGRPGGLPASGPPRGAGGDLPPRDGGRRDDPFSSEWAGPDTAAGQGGRSRSRPGLDELERTRTSARSAPAGFDTSVSSPSGGHLPGGHLPGRPPGGDLPGERLPTQLVPGDQRTGARRPADEDGDERHERPDEPPRRPHAGLTPAQESIADQALSRYKAADGRNVFGGYGESGLTPAMRRVEAHLPHGRLAPDSEQHSLKSPERYKDKLVKLIARHPGIPAADLAAEIYDAARYAFVFEPQDYTDGTWLVHRRLKAQGFDLEARRNRWDTPEFKGIRTRWRDPAHDLAFEVQFHTPASWDVVQRTHEAYLRITDPRTSPAERAELRERQVAEAAGTRPPARCAEIGDFRADVR